MTKKYDIAIIGSGLGGLICANILSRHGYSICILEKNPTLGGCLQDFKREKHHFDTGIHYIGSYNKGQNLRKIFDYLQISKQIEVKKLSEDAFDKINIAGKEYSLPQGINNFKQQLISYFPDETKAIYNYINKMNEIVKSVDILNLREIKENSFTLYDNMSVGAYDYICSLTNNQELINVLSSLNVLSNNQRTTATLHYHMVISNFYIQSAYKVLGGGRAIADALLNVAKEKNTDLMLNSEVNKVNMSDKLVNSVSLTNGKTIYADAFISDIDPLTILSLLPTKSVRKSYINRVKKFKNSIPVFSLYLIFKEKQIKYINSNYYYYKNSNSIWRDDKIDMRHWPHGFIMFTTESEKHKGYAKSAIILSQIEFDMFKKWENTTVAQRGNDYDKQKDIYASKLLEQIETVFPNFKNTIKSKYTSTPLTYRDYTGVKEGGMYGLIKDYNNPVGSILHTTTSIKNLILTGQNINLHGILGVALTALLSCGSFIDINDLIKEINEEKI